MKYVYLDTDYGRDLTKNILNKPFTVLITYSE